MTTTDARRRIFVLPHGVRRSAGSGALARRGSAPRLVWIERDERWEGSPAIAGGERVFMVLHSRRLSPKGRFIFLRNLLLPMCDGRIVGRDVRPLAESSLADALRAQELLDEYVRRVGPRC